MSDSLSVAVREAFTRLYDQGLIYRGAYIVNWCPSCQTAISDLEVVYDEHKGHLWEDQVPDHRPGWEGLGRVHHGSDYAPRNDAERYGRGDSSRG